MKQGLGLFAILGLLGLVTAVTVQCTTLRYIQSLHVAIPDPAADPAVSPMPAITRLRNPHAVLVLDVSGSMAKSDPDHLESEAALQFYRAYEQLSRETIEAGEKPRIAVVLFGTIAQTIDWTGAKEPWLEVSTQNAALFERVVERYLGQGTSEPRVGQDTDYLAAIRRVIDLTSGLTSAPAVVFLTDGAYDLHPLFSPLVSTERRVKMMDSLAGSVRAAVQQVIAGEEDFLPAHTLPGLFDTRASGLQNARLPGDLDAAAPDAMANARQDLLTTVYGDGDERPSWTPLFLGDDQRGAGSARQLLSPSGADEGDRSRFAEISDPKDLVGEFVAALSRWFRLREFPLEGGSRRFSVPEDVAAFAVSLRTASQGTYMNLVQDDRLVPLSGRDGIWSGVLVRGGDWSIDTDAGDIASGRVFLRPRNEWILIAPRRPVLTTGEELLPIELHLVQLGAGGHLPPTRAIERLPNVVGLNLASAKGKARVTLTRSTDAPVYRGSIALKELGLGKIRAVANLQELASPALPIMSGEVRFEGTVRAGIEIVVHDPYGQRTVPHVEGILREAQGVRALLDKWLPSGWRLGDNQ